MVVFPAAADVGPADADVNPASADLAWSNGVWVSNGNLVPRHLGIPTVTVPMGTMADTGMPVGLTIAGPAYGDTRLVQVAAAVTALRERRTIPSRTPELPDEAVFAVARPVATGELAVTVDEVRLDTDGVVRFCATVVGGESFEHAAFVDGVRVATTSERGRLQGTAQVDAGAHRAPVSDWLAPFGPLVVVLVRDGSGVVAGAVATTPQSPL